MLFVHAPRGRVYRSRGAPLIVWFYAHPEALREVSCAPPDVVKGAYTKVLAAVRAALEREAPASIDHERASLNLVTSPATRSAELASQFAHELERVNGHFIGIIRAGEVCKKILALISELRPRRVAVGEAVALNLAPLLKSLADSRIEVVTAGKTNDTGRTALRERLAGCDLAVVEAHYAIAATGTLVVVASPEQPGSFTLLPPTNIFVVDAAHVLPDIAQVLKVLGPATVTQHRVAFITGPSRTADIEKRIVLGVHGPKDLYTAVVWRDENENCS
jgi:L-lactate dehydrogenase complex protein LldG